MLRRQAALLVVILELWIANRAEASAWQLQPPQYAEPSLLSDSILVENFPSQKEPNLWVLPVMEVLGMPRFTGGKFPPINGARLKDQISNYVLYVWGISDRSEIEVVKSPVAVDCVSLEGAGHDMGVRNSGINDLIANADVIARVLPDCMDVPNREVGTIGCQELQSQEAVLPFSKVCSPLFQKEVLFSEDLGLFGGRCGGIEGALRSQVSSPQKYALTKGDNCQHRSKDGQCLSVIGQSFISRYERFYLLGAVIGGWICLLLWNWVRKQGQ
jgi:hypothetical protein